MPSAGAADRHAGYYYPEPESQEPYHARAQVQPDSSRATRIGFVTELSNQMMKSNPYPPPFHIFAKGDQAEKMIIVATGPNMYDTLYRMRGLLARAVVVVDRDGSVLHAELVPSIGQEPDYDEVIAAVKALL